MVDPIRGDVYSPDNLRPLSIVGCFNRIIASALRFKLARRMEEVVGKEQRGFMKDRQIIENVIEIDWEMMKVTVAGSKGALVLFDFTAAFPSVCHEYMWEALSSMGVPPQAIRAYQKLYQHNTHSIRMGGSTWDSVTVSSGVRQGCPLSRFSTSWRRDVQPASSEHTPTT